ncbi:MAG: Sigma-54 dependent transcriptional regulator (Modular protein) [Candidatus Sulfotelmatobacter sp.]|nr:Sigma-54 dependent transcriptional regulator (Modular protein) [Candidatus Sulfotelmatobacter sp.]
MNLHPGPEKRRGLQGAKAEVVPIRQAFHDNEDWYQDLVEHSHDLLCVHDLEGRLLSMNPAPARLLGYSVEEILQIPMQELVAPEFRGQFDAYLKQIGSQREAHGFLSLMTRWGERRIWEYRNTLRTEGVPSPIVRGMARDVTEQKRAEKLLSEANEGLLCKVRESESIIRQLKLFRTLVDRSNDSIQVMDPVTLRFLDANEKACAQLGYSREELLSLSVFDIDPVVTQGSTAEVAERLKREGSVSMESVHRRKDGSTFPVELSLTRVQLERSYVVAVARDLTERKKAEEKLREYKRVVEGLEDLIVVVDREYRYVITNRAYLNYRGLEREYVAGRLVAEIVGKEVFETSMKEQMDECFRGKVVRYTMKYTYPKLGERKLFLSFFPIEGPTGVDRIAVVLRDITERNRAEERLREYERVVEGLEERIVVVDREYRYVIANRAFLHNRDLPREQVIGHTVAEVLDKKTFETIVKPKMDECFGGKLVQYELKYKYPKGDERDLFVSYFPIEGPTGIDRIACILQDITESKRSEDALRHSEENYRLFVAQSSEGIFQEEMDEPAPLGLPEDVLVHRILYDAYIGECNDAMAAMYGLKSGHELRGKSWKDLVPPEDPCNVELTRQYIRSGFRLLEQESHEIDVHGTPKVFLNSMIGTVENGMLVRTWGIQRDVTEAKKLEADRQKAEEDLRRSVSQLCEVKTELEQAKEKLSEEKLYLEEAIDTELGFGEIIGRSSALKSVLEKVAKVAPSDATVLLLGETGTGKELVARALHRLSRRNGNSFIKLNCAAIPSGLLESELFGHERGAFTGAVARKLGRLELADQGTLFLDEIGEIPLSLQPKLLRVLQDQEFERLGGTQTLKVNFRLLAATNRNLLESVKEREFRSDLYYRLNVFPILIPPLRERREDIRPLIEHFVRKFAARMKKPITSIPSKTMELLVRWEWPGNIRELENFVERSVILTPGSVLQAPLSELQTSPEESNGNGNDSLRDKERERILRALRDCRGRLGGPEGAAARLGLKRTTLQSKLDHLGIKPGTYRA